MLQTIVEIEATVLQNLKLIWVVSLKNIRLRPGLKCSQVSTKTLKSFNLSSSIYDGIMKIQMYIYTHTHFIYIYYILYICIYVTRSPLDMSFYFHYQLQRSKLLRLSRWFKANNMIQSLPYIPFYCLIVSESTKLIIALQLLVFVVFTLNQLIL